MIMLPLALAVAAWLAAAGAAAAAADGAAACGGRLRAAHGTLSTPRFPHAFPLPLRCRWVIEPERAGAGIAVFLTQQYVTAGLTFTEYVYYDDTYKLGERRVFAVTEENITRVKYIQVQSPVLVVELSVTALEGTQLRALGLLSVYGLNVTYAVREPGAPVQESCSALECRLLGHCYAAHDYQSFHCSCFEGYSGPDCGVGPLCAADTCRNGGSCRQMGPAAVSCICGPGYTGDLCEAQIEAPECGLAECADGCRAGACDCTPKDSDGTSARFETKLHVIDQPNVNLSQAVQSEVTSYLKASNITLEDEIEILKMGPAVGGVRGAAVRVWAARRDAGALRAALARLVARAGPLRARLAPSALHFDMHPALSLHALTVNQRPEVWEGSEFILSCTAFGSPDIEFTWYKDGVRINFNGTTRDIWTRIVAEDALGRRISVLGVSEARRLDGGAWSCSADDAGRRRCRALWLTVLRPPDIRLIPTALTVHKGDNVSMTCLASAGRIHGVLGFSWVKDRTLLPLAPGREVWEDLYPAGSVLKLYNVQRNVEYKCQVSSVAGTSVKTAAVWALGAGDAACPAGAAHGLRWPESAPGATAVADCPPGRAGQSTRYCETKTEHHGIMWRTPDFSKCISDSLKSIYEQFNRISFGYSWTEVASIAHQYGGVLRSLPTHPGEGSVPLRHTMDMLAYLLSPAGNPKDRVESVQHLLKIFDILLTHRDAFLDEEKVYELQRGVVEAAGMQPDLDMYYQEFTVHTKATGEDGSAHFHFPVASFGDDEWILRSVGAELMKRTGNASVVAVRYHNLSSRLPSLKTSIEFKNEREVEYVLSSQQIQLASSGYVDPSLQHTVTLIFAHVQNYSAIASKLACGLRPLYDPRLWLTDVCEVRMLEQTHVSCRCRGLGTYGLFTVARSTLTESEKDLRGVVNIAVGLGGALCLVAAALQVFGLLALKADTLSIFLKVITAGANSGAMLALLECDTTQTRGCPGAFGWACAACWCAGGAALCAQPLLLHAELAGRAHRGAIVGLFAGACTLIILSARLLGSDPLDWASPAQQVCAAGSALLVALCGALTACNYAGLRSITHKVPLERRSYVRDRRKRVRHTALLTLTSGGAQLAGVAYAQPGGERLPVVALLAAAGLANGIAMLACYVLCDDACLRGAKRALGSHRRWEDKRHGDTSLSLYIKQSGEVESRGGVGAAELSPSPASPVTSLYGPPALDGPKIHIRRQSMPDSRADVVRSAEPAGGAGGGAGRGGRGVDLVAPALACSQDFPPYVQLHADTTRDTCTICARSDPDVSQPSPPIKSCLKKKGSSASLAGGAGGAGGADIGRVNREWNKSYRDTDGVLNKISHDLDFLLNRTVSDSVNEPAAEEPA